LTKRSEVRENVLDATDVAVLVPCYNEEATIADVVRTFRAQLPEAAIYVYDNNSSDNTADVARNAGAIVRNEPQQGKGHVVRRMFSDIEASIYVLVDGDDTYDAASVRSMLNIFLGQHCDMVNGRRVTEITAAYRFGHQFGNKMLTGIVNWIFGKRCDDILSGYRIFSRRFIKSFPALSTGFEIETEFTVHALSLNMPIAEVETP
jgi:glycosyltransferase involved in cell wall biosynthesis